MGIQMEKFMAASGREVLAGEDGSLMFGKAIGYLSREAAFDAEEYFQAKRDAELGRWRWPENPDYVIYPEPDEAFATMFGPGVDLVILRESDGMTKGYAREEDEGRQPAPHRVGHILAARAYFEAHPEPKPWREAKPGEVWLLTVDGHEAHFVADGNDFNGTNKFGRFICCSHDDEDITAGRRVWPEVAA